MVRLFVKAGPWLRPQLRSLSSIIALSVSNRWWLWDLVMEGVSESGKLGGLVPLMWKGLSLLSPRCLHRDAGRFKKRQCPCPFGVCFG
jgi:hypothetical protein